MDKIQGGNFETEGGQGQLGCRRKMAQMAWYLGGGLLGVDAGRLPVRERWLLAIRGGKSAMARSRGKVLAFLAIRCR